MLMHLRIALLSLPLLASGDLFSEHGYKSTKYSVHVPARTDITMVAKNKSDKGFDTKVRSVNTVLVKTNSSMGISVILEMSCDGMVNHGVLLSYTFVVSQLARGTHITRGTTESRVVAFTLGPGCIAVEPEVHTDLRALTESEEKRMVLVLTVVEN